MPGYTQTEGNGATADRIIRLHKAVRPDDSLYCFAYATTSGFAEISRRAPGSFWQSRTRWIIGIDWGRSQPTALRLLSNQQRFEVRVFDGERVANARGFVPFRAFHPKCGFLSNSRSQANAMFAGSGNFSRGGLAENHECGVSIVTRSAQQFAKSIRFARDAAEIWWENSTPVRQVITQYEAHWKPSSPEGTQESAVEVAAIEYERYDNLWVEAGYVTRNRGYFSPGNQIDLPRGLHRFFGLHESRFQQLNTTIGSITFVFPGESVTRNLRLGNNSMEKITLPIPETHGYEAYDGKILLFSRVEGGFKLSVMEVDEFRRIHGSKGVSTRMGSGRFLGAW